MLKLEEKRKELEHSNQNLSEYIEEEEPFTWAQR
jgi:hypothetical protein